MSLLLIYLCMRRTLRIYQSYYYITMHIRWIGLLQFALCSFASAFYEASNRLSGVWVCALSICWKPEHIVILLLSLIPCNTHTLFFIGHNFSIKLNRSKISFDFKWLWDTHTHATYRSSQRNFVKASRWL